MVKKAKTALAEFRNRNSPDAIKNMPRLAQGQAEDLIHDDGEGIRIWRVRVGKEDGYNGGPLSVEVYNEDEERWRTVLQ
jgi:hypothetical protein